MLLHYDIDVDKLYIDPELLACLSAQLATYYLALPLARDEEQVSVLMAYPDNHTAVARVGPAAWSRCLTAGRRRS